MSQSYYSYWAKAEKEQTSSYHLLPYHSLDVASVGSVFLTRDERLRTTLSACLGISEEDFLAKACFFLSLHDIGKFSHTFQTLKPDLAKQLLRYSSAYPYNIRHDSLGFILWQKKLASEFVDLQKAQTDRNYDSIRRYLQQWMECMTGHHGKPPSLTGNFGNRVRLNSFFDDHNITSAIEYARASRDLFFKGSSIPLPQTDDLDSFASNFFPRLSWFIAGFTVFCDWIGSDENYFAYQNHEMPLKEYWQKHALPSAQRAVEEAGVVPAYTKQGQTFSKYFTYKPTPLQTFASEVKLENSPQLFVLEDVTGSGKTEAALMLAYRLMEKGCSDGFYFGLPTMATANGMYPRVGDVYRKFFENENVKPPTIVLSHSTRKFSEPFQKAIHRDGEYGTTESKEKDETAQTHCSAWLADSSRKTFLADVGVGTIDQALLSILPSKFQSLRLFGLTRKVLIVDEVHAYDSYMLQLLQTLLTFHAALGGSAVILSATLPRRMRQALVNAYRHGLGVDNTSVQNNAYPLATHVGQSINQEIEIQRQPEKTRSVSISFINDEDVVREKILSELAQGKCVCWIRNTVIDAMESFDRLKNDVRESDILLFHARFALCDRLRIENSALDRFDKKSTPEKRRGKLLIATQVVEQSLDLDFDVMITDLAPIDLLIQRAGRLHRHKRGERGEPVLNIFSPEPVESPEENWYSSFFPRAAHVYHDHGRLWIAARLLQEKKGWTMPDDARELIEKAYSDEVNIPDTLKNRTARAESESHAAASLAEISVLNVDAGYTRIDGSWLDDGEVITRLGKKSRDILLLRCENHHLEPWCSDGKYRWEMSKVSINAELLREAVITDNEIKQVLEELQTEYPYHFKWVTALPLLQTDNGRWTCMGIDGRGNQVLCEYSSLKGFIIHKQEG